MVKFHKVAVLMGGISSERDVSLRSGAAIAQGLRDAGYDVTEVPIEREEVYGLPEGCEAVFIALHGGYGENGGVQRDLEKLGIPYTGPGPRASAIAMDKILTKEKFVAAGIPTAPYEVLHSGEDKTKLPYPLVVKPPRDGSSVGLTCPVMESNWEKALAAARKVDPEVLVERYVPGREWTVAVINDEPLPVVQIDPKSGVYDFHSKYTAGETVYTLLDDTPLTKECQALAVKACHAIGVHALGRVDFRVTDVDTCYALEVNTVPGFTATSLVPKAAAKAGIPFPDLCSRILESASFEKEQESRQGNR